jgi:DNA-binding NarL/FixJ family response regulator
VNLHRLSRREIDVLRLMCEGLTQSQVANQLGILHCTARQHGWRIREKTGCTSGAQLGVWAVRQGLIVQ